MISVKDLMRRKYVHMNFNSIIDCMNEGMHWILHSQIQNNISLDPHTSCKRHKIYNLYICKRAVKTENMQTRIKPLTSYSFHTHEQELHPLIYHQVYYFYSQHPL